MRALVVALLLLTIALVALPCPARAVSPSPCTTSVCKASITRTIATNSWGVTTVTDEVVLNSSQSVSQLIIGVPTAVSSDLRSSQATEGGGRNLQISPSTNQSYTALTVLFPTSAIRSNYNFTMTTVYWGLLTYRPGASSYTFNINPFPVIDNTYNATVSTTFTYTGGWSSPKIAPPINQTLQSTAYTAASPSFRPYNTTVWAITFASATSQNLFTVSAGRTVTITPSNSVQVTDAYNLTNLGPTVSSIPFTVPKGVSSISESYVLGLEIDQPSTTPTPTSNSDGTSTVTFSPSFGSLPFNQTVKVKISYTLSPGTYLTFKSVGSFTLSFALFSNVQFYAPLLQTKIVTPTGFRLNSVTGQVPQSSSGQILFQASNVSPVSNLGFSIAYQLDPFWATVSPLSWAALIELALAGSVIAVGMGTRSGAVVGVPVELITKFADLYDEKSSMSMESDKMEEDVARGALSRFDYRQRRRSLDRRMDEVDRALASVKAELSGESSRYQDMIKRLERAEAELQVIRTTSADLKNQNRSGKISRELYDSLSSDLIRRKERAQQAIDTVIINLREEIR
jgi:archaellum component FlaC